MKFNERLTKLRKEKGLSQEELAEKINVSRQTVSKWELGTTTPEMDKLSQLAGMFGISVDALISEENDNTEATANKTSSNSAQYVGVDEKYIPKGEEVSREKHVKEDEKSKKFVKGYIIFFVILVVLILGSTIFAFVSFSKGAGAFFNFGKNMMSESIEAQKELTNSMTDNMNKIVDNSSKNTIENSVNNSTIDDRNSLNENNKNTTNANDINLEEIRKKAIEEAQKGVEKLEKDTQQVIDGLKDADEKIKKSGEEVSKNIQETYDNIKSKMGL